MGLVIACSLILLWGGSLFTLLRVPLDEWSFAWAPFAIAAQTFLFTGLFITAHDAMHGTVAPGTKRLNQGIGRIATALYASFSYSKLLRAHVQHHAHPGRAEDPDFHADHGRGAWGWYFAFMREYLTLGQLLIQGLVFWALVLFVALDPIHVVLFWAIPALGSTTQLFFVGTYLPHRPRRSSQFVDRHHARSVDLPTWLSLLACYHFGYHLEHHHHPQVPWWRLPSLRRTTW